MKNYFKQLKKAGILFEIHTTNKLYCFGLKWGQSKIARQLKFKKKDVIKALDWANNNPKIALKILGF